MSILPLMYYSSSESRITRLCPIFLLWLLLQGCSESTESRHYQHANLASLFAEQIAPIFERRCAVACHGVDADAYPAFLLKDPVNRQAFYFPYDVQTGKIKPEDLPLVYKTAVDHHRVDYSEQPQFSFLLRAPLAEAFGGTAHRGLDVFYATTDADYQSMHTWLNLEIAANKKPSPPLSQNIAYFKDHVLGVLQRNGCFLSSCHDSQVFNDLKLIKPLPSNNSDNQAGLKHSFSNTMLLANRKVLMGNVARLVNLGGDLKQSRLITKNLPIAKGGIHQRGGNLQFFESFEDQDVKHLIAWLTLERKALVQHLNSDSQAIKEDDLGKLKGLVFIRGPRHTPRRWFSFDDYYPGSDIFLLSLNNGETLSKASTEPINLTHRFFDTAVEIQSVDVRYDVKRIVFSMRTGPHKGFRVYELRLNNTMTNVTGKPLQISFAPATLTDGTLIHHIDPVYIPGPTDKKGHDLADVAIAFASNEAGHYAQSDAWAIIGEADSSDNNTLLDKQRPEAAGTFDGRRLSIVAGPNKGQWRNIVHHQSVAGSGARLILDRPLPQKTDRRTIYVIEKPQALLQSSYDIWRFVPHSLTTKNHSTGADAKQRFDSSKHQMTYSHAQDRRPTTRTTGETMFTSVRNIGYQGDKPVFNGAIYRVQAGGFDYHVQGGNRSAYPLYSDSREMGNGLEVRLVHDPRNLWNGGLLALADHGLGINLEWDNPMDDSVFSRDSDASDIEFSSPPRFIPAQVHFFKETGNRALTHTGVSPGGSVRDPYPLLNGTILISFTPDKLDHLDKNANPDWDIYLFEFVNSPHTKTGDSVGEFRRIKIAAASSELAEYSPRPLMLRLKENAQHPIDHQKFGSRSQDNPPQEKSGMLSMPAGLPGEIECYDYPLLQSFLTNFAPVGAKDFSLAQANPNGVITPEDRVFKYVRVIMQVDSKKAELQPIHRDIAEGDPFATRVSSGIHGKRVIVAEVPIEDDGSFFVEVPSNVPLIIQGLNANKMAMHSMNRWVYLQPGEKLTFGIPRSIFPLRCAGCHGSLTGEPLEGIGPADLVSASSRVMATWNQGEQKRRLAYGYGKNKSSAGQNQARYAGIDFKTDVQPILNQHCTVCHHSNQSPAQLDLRDIPTQYYNTAYESLHQLSETASGNYADKRFINEREALSSESLLIQSIRGKQGTPHLQQPLLTPQQMLTLIRWIDLGATYQGVPSNKAASSISSSTSSPRSITTGEKS